MKVGAPWKDLGGCQSKRGGQRGERALERAERALEQAERASESTQTSWGAAAQKEERMEV